MTAKRLTTYLGKRKPTQRERNEHNCDIVFMREIKPDYYRKGQISFFEIYGTKEGHQFGADVRTLQDNSIIFQKWLNKTVLRSELLD